MKLNMYVIYDAKAEVYNKPFYLLNDDVARRSAEQLMQDGNTDIARHPEDFTMFKLGTFDDTACMFDFLDSRIPVINFIELKKFQSTSNDELIKKMEYLESTINELKTEKKQ
ncbi:nonstructural protein [Microviridae sp.]|nr:nonstructural protein [Microviridae sp.]